jgi:hypothetical protein
MTVHWNVGFSGRDHDLVGVSMGRRSHRTRKSVSAAATTAKTIRNVTDSSRAPSRSSPTRIPVQMYGKASIACRKRSEGSASQNFRRGRLRQGMSRGSLVGSSTRLSPVILSRARYSEKRDRWPTRVARPEASGNPAVALGAAPSSVASRGVGPTRLAHRDLPVHLRPADGRETGMAAMGRTADVTSRLASPNPHSPSMGVFRRLAATTNIFGQLSQTQHPREGHVRPPSRRPLLRMIDRAHRRREQTFGTSRGGVCATMAR